jgi:uncharacterized membrane protein YkvA (DUF1232 family)
MLTEADFDRDDLPHRDDFYQRLRARIERWLLARGDRSHRYGEILLVAPDLFHLLIKLSLDPRVPRREKLLLGAATAYFITALDFIPELLLGPGGYVDDLGLAAYVIYNIVRESGEQVVREHWAGPGDILALLERILRNVTDLVGTGVWGRIKAGLRGHPHAAAEAPAVPEAPAS